jgi:tRNA/rRNA methyltransferase
VAVSKGEPTIAGTQLTVGALVRACHDATIEEALATAAVEGLDRATLEPILTYCAERRCEADAATCPGCRLATLRLGIRTFDEFVAHHGAITFESSPLALFGRGTSNLSAKSLDHLARTWGGEEYWFWARRVLRKLRYGPRRSGQSAAPSTTGEGQEPCQGAAPVFVLVRPQLADNIGMTARAMANFGLEELRLVEPRDGWPNEKARFAASGANFIIDGVEACTNLATAVRDMHWIGATSARQRDLVKPILTPEQAVGEMRRRLSAGQRCAVLFGPERNGLGSEEVASADALVMAPVNPNFASLNLAQAVLLLSYEWRKQAGGGTLGRVTTYESPVTPGMPARAGPPATKEELFAFFTHLEGELDGKGFLYPPEKRPSMVHNMRTMFTRMGATQQEIRTLRGIVKALVHGRRRARSPP